ncbi:MAG: hypothetical protein IJM52_03210 [Spirochaetales bacterium]|nr:hypothetical protein [Spirochaetales bacterium]
MRKTKEKKKKNRRYLSSYEIELSGVGSKLSEYYDYDEKKKVFEIPLHYEKASDLYCPNVDFKEKPNISDETTDNMVDLLQDIPDGRKAEFSITIDDYEGIAPGKVLEGINDALALRHLRFIHEDTAKGIKVGMLMFFGASLILLKTYGILFGWWGEGNVSSDLFTYILDIFGCVLIWESIYGVFVDRSEEIAFEKAISKKVHAIKLYDESGNKALSGEGSSSLITIMGRNKKKQISNRLLLLSGFSLLAASISDLLWTIQNASTYTEFGLLSVIVAAVIGLISALVIARVGFVAISIYRGRFTKNITGAILTVIMLGILVGNIVTLNISAREVMISTIFKIIVEAAFVVGLVLRFSYFIELNKSYREKHNTEAGK